MLQERVIVRILRRVFALRRADADQIILFSCQQPRDGGWRVLAQVADLQYFPARLLTDLDVRSAVYDIGDGRRGDARLARDVVDGDPLFGGRLSAGALLIAQFLADGKDALAR